MKHWLLSTTSHNAIRAASTWVPLQPLLMKLLGLRMGMPREWMTIDEIKVLPGVGNHLRHTA